MKKADLEKRIEELEIKIRRLEKPYIPPTPTIPYQPNTLDPLCLHNHCRHDINPACNLYCPHCGPKY